MSMSKNDYNIVGTHGSCVRSKKQTSNSFEFTSYWAKKNNEPILDLVDFTQTFLAKHTILNILTRYCVFTSENMLLVMRPYQIAATEEIIRRVNVSTNAKTWGKREGGGYIWHTVKPSLRSRLHALHLNCPMSTRCYLW